MEDLTKEVLRFRRRVSDIIKAEIPGVTIPGPKDGYGEDILIINNPRHKHVESVFKVFLRIRPLIWVESYELVKYLDSSVPAIERAVAKTVLAEGTKKILTLLPLYTKLLPWYSAKIERQYVKMDEDKAAAAMKAEALVEESFKRQVRRIVLDKYVSKGAFIPELWINDEVYSAQRLVENFQKFGKECEDM